MQVYNAVGRRKRSIARVTLKPGKGEIIVNGRPLMDYFKRPILKLIIEQPFVATDTLNKFDIKATIVGGGLSGQAGALRHGIARALLKWNDELRPALRRGGFLTRDPREVERKKPGQPKARKRFQFSKR
ncbi:MAG: 30S ribosomal protein S9 [Calditrichia bacterium]